MRVIPTASIWPIQGKLAFQHVASHLAIKSRRKDVKVINLLSPMVLVTTPENFFCWLLTPTNVILPMHVKTLWCPCFVLYLPLISCQSEDPSPTPWPGQFHTKILQTLNEKLSIVHLWYDLPNFNIIQQLWFGGQDLLFYSLSGGNTQAWLARGRVPLLRRKADRWIHLQRVGESGFYHLP